MNGALHDLAAAAVIAAGGGDVLRAAHARLGGVARLIDVAERGADAELVRRHVSGRAGGRDLLATCRAERGEARRCEQQASPIERCVHRSGLVSAPAKTARLEPSGGRTASPESA